jgi:hypothetical protein
MTRHGLFDDPIRPSPAEVCTLAQELGLPVFPVKLLTQPSGKIDKVPLIKEWPLRASSDPVEIARLWRSAPGDLIGIVTGSRSGIDVLDLDKKHPQAGVWWRANHRRLPATRCYRTYSGGVHLYFRHRDGITNTTSKIAPGVDSRGQGGFIVYWFAYGCDCLDVTPPQAMPQWLYDELTYRPPPPSPAARAKFDPDKATDGILRKLGEAQGGNRNGMLYWCARRLLDRGHSHASIEAMLLPICANIGLLAADEIKKTYGTIKSAVRGRAAA